jgi:hypothetical protein
MLELPPHLSPSRPRPSMPDSTPTIQIGLVGHRRNNLSATSLAELPGRLCSLFAEIATAAGDASVALLTGMADGTDLIGAAIRPPSWSLVAILTEPPEVLARRMGDADAAEMLRLTNEAHTVLEVLPGRFDDYRGQADAILARARLLVAVWDGAPSRGPGGTADSIDRAQALQRPIVVLPVRGGPARWMGGKWGGTVDAAAMREVL